MLKLLDKSQLDMILGWRNDPYTRSLMLTSHLISHEEHMRWWDMLQKDDTKRVLVYYDEQDQPLAVIHIYDYSSEEGVCYWGFYVNPELNKTEGKAITVWLGLEEATIQYVQCELRCTRLLCETLAKNDVVISVHKRFDFKVIETFKHKTSKNVQDVVLMELPLGQVLTASILGSANWELMPDLLLKSYSSSADKILNIVPVPFGQYGIHINDATSSLRENNPDYVVFAERVEDFMPPFELLAQADQAEILQRFQSYLELIKHARLLLSGVFFVLDFMFVKPAVGCFSDGLYQDKNFKFIQTMNHQLIEHCEAMDDCYVIKNSSLLCQFGLSNAYAEKYWYMGRVPYSIGFMRRLAQEVCGAIQCSEGGEVRVVVLDLDNTLWSGVLGDDGPDGIELGGDYPGCVFSEIQRFFKSLRDKGILLAVCSKNTESIVLEFMESSMDMVLKVSDFSGLKINWDDKASNIVALSEALGLGLKSFMFVDDSPYERGLVSQSLPDVFVPQMPEDPCQWLSFLSALPQLEKLNVTGEDLKRSERYVAKQKISDAAKQFENREDFLKSLDMELSFYAYNSDNQARTLQLIAKTNQFNMTTRRHKQSDLSALIDSGAVVVPIGLSDKFSTKETIGVVVLRPLDSKTLEVETFVLSCRVLGRDVEKGIMHWVHQYAKAHKFSYVQGLFEPTDRNLAAVKLYPELGYKALTAGRTYQLDLQKYKELTLEHVQVGEDEYATK